ncbi:hypothetical protein PYW08_010020 [Mythimna loreyi]|uniref:Uncharacterized protein n=1 Tax=Mythimna loreyi TaxID=667449 RepID=A0ACC2QA87_9NEOP|nr:hypothetical protein PYW08_010020 [Mythimna loreyi]
MDENVLHLTWIFALIAVEIKTDPRPASGHVFILRAKKILDTEGSRPHQTIPNNKHYFYYLPVGTSSAPRLIRISTLWYKTEGTNSFTRLVKYLQKFSELLSTYLYVSDFSRIC